MFVFALIPVLNNGDKTTPWGDMLASKLMLNIDDWSTFPITFYYTHRLENFIIKMTFFNEATAHTTAMLVAIKADSFHTFPLFLKVKAKISSKTCAIT